MKKEKAPIAVIDIGAHFARLEIVQITEDGNKYETLERLSQIAPLGTDVFTKGKISTENTYLVGKILQDFSQVLKDYKVKQIRAVATSAVREASNKELFLNRVRRLSGIKVEELETEEEAKILFIAIKEALNGFMSFTEKNSVICSIGTGAIQVSFTGNGMLKSSESARIGSLRLIEELERNISANQLKDAIKPFVETAVKGILSQSLTHFSTSLIIGTGASVRALTTLGFDSGETEYHNVKCLSRKSFYKIYNEISKLPPEDIAQKYKISDTLAESIEPACAILYHFLEASKVESLIIPTVTTRDAIIKNFIKTIQNEPDDFLPHITSCVKSLGEKYRYDSIHAGKVADISLAIFDSTIFLHALNDNDRKLLMIASYLHDIGAYVSNRKHHKHSFYLIKNSNIPGLTSKERNIAAIIARYHRRALPKSTHSEYSALSSADKVRVSSLASILRIADSLDFIYHLTIKEIKFNHRGKIMEIITNQSVDSVLKNWAVKRKADLFEDVFGYKVRIIGR